MTFRRLLDMAFRNAVPFVIAPIGGLGVVRGLAVGVAVWVTLRLAVKLASR